MWEWDPSAAARHFNEVNLEYQRYFSVFIDRAQGFDRRDVAFFLAE